MLRFDQVHRWPRTMIFAHRGAGHSGPRPTTHENTVDAFRKAIEIGADGIELDVRRTADGVLVVHHDEKIKRYRRRLSEMTFEEAGEGARKRGYRLPSLEETLRLCAGRIALDIELKEASYEDEVLRMTRQYYDLKHVCFTSFIDGSVKRIKDIDSRALAGLLLGAQPPAKPGTRIREIFPIRRVRRCKADFVAPNRRLLRLGYMQRIEKAGYPIIAWTVNSRNRAGNLMDRGVAAIITDVPERMIEMREM